MDSTTKKIKCISTICSNALFDLNKKDITNEVQIISRFDWIKITKINDSIDADPDNKIVYELEYYTSGSEKPSMKVTTNSFYVLTQYYLESVLQDHFYGDIEITDNEGDTLAKFYLWYSS